MIRENVWQLEIYIGNGTVMESAFKKLSLQASIDS